jgi:hypothetical protein
MSTDGLYAVLPSFVAAATLMKEMYDTSATFELLESEAIGEENGCA